MLISVALGVWQLYDASLDQLLKDTVSSIQGELLCLAFCLATYVKSEGQAMY